MTEKNIISVKVGCDSLRPYENIIFYRNGAIVYQISSQALELKTIKDNKLQTVNKYDKVLMEIYIHEPRAARKLDLTKNDNFTFKTTSDSWIRKEKDLYIYCGVGGDVVLEYAGEYESFKNAGETSYKKAYNLEFINGVEMDFFHYDRYVMEDPENYQLQPGERFSEYYGSRENPCVWSFDNKDHEQLFKKLNPGKPWKHEKGIVKRWHATEKVFEKITVSGYGYSRTEKTEDRKNREDLAAVLSKALNKSISHYDVEKLLEVVNITLK